jgi:mannose-6-phosphate isomerase-like protein (cupin superfamily)
MAQAHFFHASKLEWQSHPTIRGIHIKSLENKSTLGTASVTLVEVDPGSVIEPHLHEQSSETAYVISGCAVLTLPDGDVTLSAGDGVTVPPRTLHSLRNTADEPVDILAVHIPPTL